MREIYIFSTEVLFIRIPQFLATKGVLRPLGGSESFMDYFMDYFMDFHPRKTSIFAQGGVSLEGLEGERFEMFAEKCKRYGR